MSKALQSFCFWAAVAALAQWVPGAWAQKKEPASAPYPPISLGESSSKAAAQEPGAPKGESHKTTAETPALSSAQEFTPGGSRAIRSFMLPRVNFYEQADTNPFTSARPGGAVTLTSVLGSLALQRNSGRSELTLNYVGGGTVSNRQSLSSGQTDSNSIIQQLEATQSINWRRWTLLMGNQFSYSPESSFGSFEGGLGSFGPTVGGSLGEGLPGLRSVFTPNQSILTGRGARASNTVLTQVEYRFSSRSSVTTAGVYGFLRFFDSDLQNSYNAMFLTGYNYRVTSEDTLGIIYRFSAFRFTGLDGAIDDHVAELAYGRRITGRLSFRLGASPEVILLRIPGVPSQSRLFWGLESALHYHRLDLSYLRGVTAGAGVLAGAETNQVEGSATQGLSRMWQGSLGLGYANNRNVGQTSTLGQNFSTWYGRVRLSRPVGRSADLFLGYVIQLQGSSSPFCTGLVCARSLVRHQITLGFSWHLRPIAID